MIKKIKNQFKIIKCHFKNFGFKYSLLYILSRIFKKMLPKYRKEGINIIEKEFNYLFDDVYKDYVVPAITNDEKCFFIFWKQGKNELPKCATLVLEQLKKYYPDYKIIILDETNYSDYVTLDPHIIKLYRENKITVQTFSDILRFNLLYKYGGVWVDATLLFFSRIDLFKEVQTNGLYSINHNSKEKNAIWDKVYDVTYTTYFLATHKENPIMGICVKFYNDYYKKYDYAIDYFMNDYILILCSKKEVANNQLKKISFNSGNPYYLVGNLDKEIKDFKCLRSCPQKTDWRNFDSSRIECIIKMNDSMEV